MKTAFGLMFILIMGISSAFASVSTSQSDYHYFNKQKTYIFEASKLTGISPELVTAIGSIESGLGRNKVNQYSKVKGVMQTTKRTYNSNLKKHHERLGLSPNASIKNDRANILVATAALADNKRYLEKVTNKEITDGDVFISHLVGLGGAAKIIKGKPNAPISRYITLHKGNMRLYTDKGRVLTVAQFRRSMDRLVKKESAKYAVVINQNKLDRLITAVAYNQ